MRRIIPLLLIAIILAGCKADSQSKVEPEKSHYDIDLQCEKRNLAHPVEDNGMTQFPCAAPKMFIIWCVTNTVQYIDDVYFCNTQNGKSVRITIQK